MISRFRDAHRTSQELLMSFAKLVNAGACLAENSRPADQHSVVRARMVEECGDPTPRRNDKVMISDR